MQGNLSIKGITVQNIYSQYLNGTYMINRRYQRKLVWGIEEKEKFIDSLLQGFPIPMIIAANFTKPDGKSAFEILDGMQRLNAIVSFIEGEFSVNGKFYDLETVAQTKKKIEEGDIIQNHPILDNSDCAKILDYPVPFSICDNNDTKKVDESFRRINTGGRTLSKQDVRQAGALGQIPDLVRRCSIYIRRDSSHSDIVDLKNMKSISLSNRGLGYGINLHNVFWAKHGVITYENIRMSRDEELVAHLVSYIASPTKSETTARYLDQIYDETSLESEELNLAINKLGVENVYKQFCFVFDEVRKTLESNNHIFKNLVFGGRPNKTPSVFQIVFIAFYKALIVNNLKVSNYRDLCLSLENVFDKYLKALEEDRKLMAQEREKLSESVYGIVKGSFKARSGSEKGLSSWVSDLENILNQSKTEQVCYDFKMGFHKISDGSGEFIEKTFDKVVKTLTAMVNSRIGECYVIVGVADKESDAKVHKEHYGSEYIKYNDFCIVGIDGEANQYVGSLEAYQKKVLQLISTQPITDEFKQILKGNLVTFSYHNREILLLKASRGAEPERYDDNIYRRNLSHLELVKRNEEFKFFETFVKESRLAQM